MSLKRFQSETMSQVSKKSPNLKILSGVYREDYQTRLKAYNLSPRFAYEKVENTKGIKASYELEIRYLNEYISILKQKLNGRLSISEQDQLEDELRSEISELFEKLKNEQKNNFLLLEKIEFLTRENLEMHKKNADDNRERQLTLSTGLGYQRLDDIYHIKQYFIQQFNEHTKNCENLMTMYSEKLETLEFVTNKIKNEIKVIEKGLVLNYKNKISEKNSKINDQDQKLNYFQHQISELKEKNKQLESDLWLYSEENNKQKELIKGMSDLHEKNNQDKSKKFNDSELVSIEIDREADPFSRFMASSNSFSIKSTNQCSKCGNFQGKNNFLDEMNKKLKQDNEKYMQKIKLLHEDNQNLESIVEKLQDFILLKENSYASNENLSESTNSQEKTLKLQEDYNKLSKLLENYKKMYQQKCQDFSELSEKLKLNESKLLEIESEIEEKQNLSKDYESLSQNITNLEEIKSKFFDLLKILKENKSIEKEIREKYRHIKFEPGMNYQQLTDDLNKELLKNNMKMQEIIANYQN